MFHLAITMHMPMLHLRDVIMHFLVKVGVVGFTRQMLGLLHDLCSAYVSDLF